jgi:hypothetical protein
VAAACRAVVEAAAGAGSVMRFKQFALLAAVAAGTVVSMVSIVASQDATQAPPSPDQLVAALKQNLADGQKKLRQYEWVETTVISLKGEEKARKQQRVYYGADGKLTKIPIGAPPAKAESQGGGGGRSGRLKERVVENKKDDMQEYMQKAVALVHKYVPPSPELIQKAKDGKKLTVQPPQAGRVRVELKDFVQPADLMTIDVDAKALVLGALNVTTYLEKKEDVVTLDVRFGTLADGTSYSAKTTFEAKAKNITVVIENGGHRPLVK